MSPKKNNIKDFFKALPKNIFSGFVVSLIALPLGLGLAMASDAPPIAGIIAAIVGGIVVSILGGSHVTIAGPGNGLVGVLLIAISTLGLENAYVAIIFSGVLLMALGFFRMGTLADFFPSSAIQGMLAAIGLIILGKQFHIMLAHKINREDTVDYLIEIPYTINDALHYGNKSLIYAALAGVISLVVMVFYSKIRNKYLQLIPAPMWIVIISIGFSYYFELILRTSNAVTELKRYSRGITDFRLRLYWDEFKDIRVPVPPLTEIVGILNSINEINLKYDKLMLVAEGQIKLLKERRTALISAAVTGKIDVRDWKVPEQNQSNKEVAA